jgi:energy-coupling factor transporter transmembrane protein EcfT
LAVALDARGFDGVTRATARPSPWTRGDTAWAAGGAGIAAAVTAASVALGSWQWFAG